MKKRKKKKLNKKSPDHPTPSNKNEKVDSDYILTKHEKLIVTGIFILALILKLFHLHEIYYNDPSFTLPSVDSLVYHHWAVKISDGAWLGKEVFYGSPLYPYFIGIIYKIFGQNIFLIKFFQSLIGALNCILVYVLAKKVFNDKVGFIAGIITTFYGMFTFYEGIMLVTNIQTPLNILLILLLLNCFENPSIKKWIICGICLGFSAIARPNIMLLAPFVLFWILFIFKEHKPIKQILLSQMLFCLGIGLIIFPVSLRNLTVGDEFVATTSQGGISFYLGNNPDSQGYFSVPRILSHTRGDSGVEIKENFKNLAEQDTGKKMNQSEVSHYWLSKSMDYIWDKPWEWMGLQWKKLRLFINHEELWSNRSYDFDKKFSWVLRLPLFTFGIVVPFGLLGIMLSFNNWKRFFLLYSIIATYALALVLIYVNARYRMPVIPYFIVFASYSIYWLFKNAYSKKYLNMTVALFSLAFIYHIVNQDIVINNYDIAHYNLANKYKKMGKWEMAIEHYEQSIKLNPRYISSHNNLAMTYEEKSEWHDKAIHEWKIVLKMAEERQDQKYINRAQRHLRKLSQNPN